MASIYVHRVNSSSGTTVFSSRCCPSNGWFPVKLTSTFAKDTNEGQGSPNFRFLALVAQPITSLQQNVLWKTYWETIKCHYFGVQHGDISILNLMHRNRTCVLSDFDLVPSIIPGKLHPRGFDPPGLMPFPPLDLLVAGALSGKVERRYRHGLESFFWVLAWIIAHYDNGAECKSISAAYRLWLHEDIGLRSSTKTKTLHDLEIITTTSHRPLAGPTVVFRNFWKVFRDRRQQEARALAQDFPWSLCGERSDTSSLDVALVELSDEQVLHDLLRVFSSNPTADRLTSRGFLHSIPYSQLLTPHYMSNAKGPRKLCILPFDTTQPITSLQEKALWKAYWEIINCHYIIWKGGIHHGNISISNPMHCDGMGLLNDFDLSPSTTPGNPYFRGFDRTITPFKALDLLSVDAQDRKVEPRYRHDLESFFWVLVWIATCYDNGVQRISNSDLRLWLHQNVSACLHAKSHILRDRRLLVSSMTNSYLPPVLSVLHKYWASFFVQQERQKDPSTDELMWQKFKGNSVAWSSTDTGAIEPSDEEILRKLLHAFISDPTAHLLRAESFLEDIPFSLFPNP
ncbi:hypothetical protein M413DRAFT_26308 [Hebeloma cylindrosporum]|uniref:Fungal-type protein kinase domain-containing protein n=1 Tax=Hebeloma cylindrosporum TaxID=76867 RepID=A0A0C3CG48_HEBCY|nr:hypothetical protein M413DRAFT_26308 [Hebeloma cylindrosporum h7]